MATFETQELAADLGLPLTVDSEAITLGDMTEVVVVSEAGTFSCADVWFNVASSWIPRVTVRLYARLGAARVLVRQVTLSAAPTTTGGDGSLSGIAISVRGRPCTAFEVTCQATAGAALTNGLFYLQAWHSHAEPSTSGGTEVPETPTAVPMLAAAMLARNESTGALTEVATDSSGRLIVTSPYFDSIDKQRLEDATAAAATGALALRDSGGGSKFTSVTINTASVDRGKLLYDTAMRARALDGAAELAIDWEPKATAGAGKATSVRGQKGNGNAGGTLTLASGEGGTPGTHLGGDVIVDVGATVTNASAKLQINAGGTRIATIEQLSAANQRLSFGTGGGTSAGGTIDGQYVNIESRSSHVAIVSNHDVYVGHALGRSILHREVGNVVLTETLDADGATSFAFDPGPTSILFKQNKKSGNGVSAAAPFSILAQDGQNVASGTNNTGADLVLGSGLVGTGGSGGADGKVSLRSGASDVLLDVQKDPSGANGTLATVGSSRSGLTLLATATNQRLELRTGSGGSIYLDTDNLKIRDRNQTSRFTVTPAAALDVTIDSACTSFILSQTARAGTGASAGAPTKIKAQAGQAVASGTNNNGGDVEVNAGAKGTGGTGGSNGAVVLLSGTSQRVRAEESDVKLLPGSGGNLIHNWGTASAAALIEMPHATAQTTDATVTTAWTYVPTVSRVAFIEVIVVARDSTNNGGAAYILRGCFKNVSGTISTIGSIVNTEFSAESTTAMNCTLEVNAGAQVRVRVTGLGAGGGGPANIRWEIYPRIHYAQG